MKSQQQRSSGTVLGTAAIIFLAVVSTSISTSVFAVVVGGISEFEKEILGLNKPVDEYFELGESYYKSPRADGSRLEYCVLTDKTGLKKISRRSVRSFRNGPKSHFVNKLLHCSDPSVKIVDIVPAEETDAILYYLNKRFKLRLKDS